MKLLNRKSWEKIHEGRQTHDGCRHSEPVRMRWFSGDVTDLLPVSHTVVSSLTSGGDGVQRPSCRRRGRLWHRSNPHHHTVVLMTNMVVKDLYDPSSSPSPAGHLSIIYITWQSMIRKLLHSEWLTQPCEWLTSFWLAPPTVYFHCPD